MTEEGVLTPEALKAWRVRLGLSQPEAAEQLGVALRTVQSWESGQYRIPLSVALALKWLSEPGPAFEGAKPARRAGGREAERESEG